MEIPAARSRVALSDLKQSGQQPVKRSEASDRAVLLVLTQQHRQRHERWVRQRKSRPEKLTSDLLKFWSRRQDLNRRLPGYEPSELTPANTQANQLP